MDKNCTLKKNILQLVANRMKPNPSVNLLKNCCSTCIQVSRKQSHQKFNKTKAEKDNDKLSLCSNVYEISFTQIYSEEEKQNESLPKLLERKTLNSNPNQTTFTMQQMEAIVKEWVNYALNYEISSVKNKIVLPLQSEQMKGLRKQIDQIISLKYNPDESKIQPQGALNVEKQGEYQFIDKICESDLYKTPQQKKVKQQEYLSTMIYENQKNQPWKLIKSISTISSQKCFGRAEQLSDTEMLRLLLVQATTIQNYL